MIKTSGIYCILNKENNKTYIGSAINIKDRWRYHLKDLKNKKHHSSYLQKSWDKYGEKFFYFYVLEFCGKKDLIKKEQKWLDLFQSFNSEYGYNMCKTSGSPLGYKHSEKTKNKMRSRKKRYGEDHHFFGKNHTEETKKKISENKKGYKHKEDTKIKMSQSHIGLLHSEETLKKLSLLNKGENNPTAKLTNEDVRKIRELYNTNNYTLKKLGELFSVNFRTISQIINNKRYKNI